MTAPSVVVLDYGSGNLRSAVRAVERAGAEAELTSDATRRSARTAWSCPVSARSPPAWPGWGVEGVRIIERRLAGGRPVLGICVGMQILFERGVEHGVETDGLRRVARRRRAAAGADRAAHGLEHRRGRREGSRLFAGIEDERFYFVHSYGVRDWDAARPPAALAPPLVTWTEHGGDRFVSAVENGPLCGDPVPPGEVRRRRRPAAPPWVESLGRSR